MDNARYGRKRQDTVVAIQVASIQKRAVHLFQKDDTIRVGLVAVLDSRGLPA